MFWIPTPGQTAFARWLLDPYNMDECSQQPDLIPEEMSKEAITIILGSGSADPGPIARMPRCRSGVESHCLLCFQRSWVRTAVCTHCSLPSTRLPALGNCCCSLRLLPFPFQFPLCPIPVPSIFRIIPSDFFILIDDVTIICMYVRNGCKVREIL